MGLQGLKIEDLAVDELMPARHAVDHGQIPESDSEEAKEEEEEVKQEIDDLEEVGGDDDHLVE